VTRSHTDPLSLTIIWFFEYWSPGPDALGISSKNDWIRRLISWQNGCFGFDHHIKQTNHQEIIKSSRVGHGSTLLMMYRSEEQQQLRGGSLAAAELLEGSMFEA